MSLLITNDFISSSMLWEKDYVLSQFWFCSLKKKNKKKQKNKQQNKQNGYTVAYVATQTKDEAMLSLLAKHNFMPYYQTSVKN